MRVSIKNLLLIMGLVAICFPGQTQDSLTFSIKLKVHTDSKQEPIDNASIRFISTNGTDTTLYTNYNGEITYKTHEIGSFTLIANYEGYYSLNNNFTTLHVNHDSSYYLEFRLKEIIRCVMYLPLVNFELNTASVELDSLNYIYNTLVENPTLVMEVIGHQTDQEEKRLSKRRAKAVKKALMNKGIPRKRLKLVDGKNESPSNPYCVENRCVTFSIISDDFKFDVDH